MTDLLDFLGDFPVIFFKVILRSTIITLRNHLDTGIDLLRLECLEGLDCKTRNRLLEKKYKYGHSS